MKNRLFFAVAFVAFGVVLRGVLSGDWSSLSHYEQHAQIQNAENGTDSKAEAVSAEERTADYALYLDILTAFLVIVTAGQIYFLTRADNTARMAAKAAERAAKATEATVEKMEATAERQLRAYIWVKAVELLDFQIGAVPWVALQLRNSGQTPAHDVEASAGCVFKPFPLPEGTEFPRIRQTASRSKLTLHPGAEPPFQVSAPFSYPENESLSVQELPRFTQPGGRLYVFALVKYRDAFGRERETRFCNWIDLSGPNPAFGYPDQHNTAT